MLPTNKPFGFIADEWELYGSFRNEIAICSGSQSAIKLAEREGIKLPNKHIDVTYHFVRDVFSRNEVRLEYKSTSKIVADALAKPLLRTCLKGPSNQLACRAKGEQSKLIKGECWWNTNTFSFFDGFLIWFYFTWFDVWCLFKSISLQGSSRDINLA